LDPGRVWRKRSIDNHISRLRERGLVRRVRKAKGTELAIYARLGVAVDAGPFGDKTLVQVMATVLESAGKPMTQTELVVAMREAGYHSTMTPQALRNAVGAELRKEVAFCKADGRWTNRN
jgi:DNA-binding transcriptional ArsR family regulator